MGEEEEGRRIKEDRKSGRREVKEREQKGGLYSTYQVGTVSIKGVHPGQMLLGQLSAL